MINLIFIFIATHFLFPSNDNIIVQNISIIGNERISKKDILLQSGLFPGMKLKSDEIPRAIKRLWNLDRFGDIQIYIDKEDDQGIYLIIEVSEYPVLNEIKFQGNKKKSARALKEELELAPGQILTERAIFEATQKIKSLYLDKNFHSIEIKTLLESNESTNSQDLTFQISEGNKQKIKKINIEGNKILSKKKILRKLKDTKEWKWYLPWRGSWNYSKFETDKTTLSQFYKNNGYRDFYIIRDTIVNSSDEADLNLNIMLYEGPQYFIRDITWDGNYIHSDSDLNERLNFNKGSLFEQEKFNLAISEKVSPLYTDQGYFYFQIEPQITPVGVDSIDIKFNIIENNIVTIRKILIKGNLKTNDNVIRRELRVFPGDTFSRKKLMDSYRDIFMLNFFENVIPDIVPISDNEIDIKLEVLEKSTGQANFSMGYNGTYGFTGGGGFEFPNFRGNGQTLSISYQRGINSNQTNPYSNYNNFDYNNVNTDIASYQSFSVSFVEPWLFDTPNLIGGSYFYTERGRGQGNPYNFDIKQHGASLRFGRRFKWPDSFFRGSWLMKGSDNQYFADSPNILTDQFSGIDNNDIDLAGNMFKFSASGISITQIINRDSRNHPEFPTIGSKSIWTTTLSGYFIGGDEEYHKHILDFNWFTPINKKTTYSQVFKAGILLRRFKNSIIPPSATFIMGGTGIPYGEMLRGYPDYEIRPYGYSHTRGGDIMLKYSFELRFSLSQSPTIYALSFFDIGNVWSEINIVDPFNLKRSAGLGIRVFIPMLGMLGYDIGYGFDPTAFDTSNEAHGWEYHLIFGMPF